MIHDKNTKYLVRLSFLIALILLALLPLPKEIALTLLQSSSSLKINVSVKESQYYLREKVTITGNVTLRGALVAIEVCNPRNTTIIYRTVTVGDPIESLPVNITEVYITDLNDNPINILKVDTRVRIHISVKNLQKLSPIKVFTTATMFDGNHIPVGNKFVDIEIQPDNIVTSRLEIYIPPWASPGIGFVCGNIYQKEPKEGGFPYAQEKLAAFYISRTEQSFVSYTFNADPWQTVEEETFTSSFRLSPEPLPNNYWIYAVAQRSLLITAQDKTSFSVQSLPYPPQASFTYSPPIAYINMTLTFDASSSSAEGYNDIIIKYEWDFGDGTSKVIKEGNFTNPPDPIVTHKFGNIQTYIVTLNVTDNEGLWSTTSKPVTISQHPNLTANFTWSPETPRYNQTVIFNASLSTMGWDPINGRFSPIISYKWNFGDGTGNITVTTPIIEHTFLLPENYTVTLTITDDVGRSDVEIHVISIQNVTLITDINGDGVVDITDVAMVAYAYGSTPGDPRWDARCDLNNDLVVDITDVAMVAYDYGKTA
jgi:hypothetical protein